MVIFHSYVSLPEGNLDWRWRIDYQGHLWLELWWLPECHVFGQGHLCWHFPVGEVTQTKHTAWRERWTDLGKEMSDDIRIYQRYMIYDRWFGTSIGTFVGKLWSLANCEWLLFSHLSDPDGQGSDVFKCAVAGAPVTSPDPPAGWWTPSGWKCWGDGVRLPSCHIKDHLTSCQNISIGSYRIP